MLQLAPMEKDFVPYSRRPVRKNNAGLFVKGGKRKAAGVALQGPPGGCNPGDCCPPRGSGLKCGQDGYCHPDHTCD
jgi:hypothetical protein